MASFSASLDPDDKEHIAYVDRMWRLKQHFEQTTVEIFAQALDYWNLFLAIEEDKRDPIDEQWRSRIFIPQPFSVTRTKAAQLVETLGNTEPVWQVESARENKQWQDEGKSAELQLDYVHRMNSWRKLLLKLGTLRSVMGTSFLKINWVKKSRFHVDIPTTEDQARFMDSIDKAVSAGAAANQSFVPDWRTDPDRFDKWAQTVNTAGLHGTVLPRPTGLDGTPREFVDYEGPIFRLPSLWSIALDPMIDEIADQKVVIHRIVVPLSYVVARADNDPGNDSKPYILANVEHAMNDWDGTILNKEEESLANKLGLSPQKESHPYFEKPVVLWEVWSSDEKFKHAIIMNAGGGRGGTVINKTPFEDPLLTTMSNLFMVRNILIPGHAYGLSDYHEAKYLFEELNSFRRLRMDRAVLTTLGVYAKTAGVRLGDQMKKISPGAIIEVPGAPAASIHRLIEDNVPAEAYREPPEMKLEIEDATEVPNWAKGMGATVGHVTGTEYQGRANQTSLKFKVDASLVEDELLGMPPVIFSFLAQLGSPDMKDQVGGTPNPLVTMSKQQLIQAIGYRYRLRGATKNIQPDMQVQQLLTSLREFPDVLSPMERRAALQQVMMILDIRGWSQILTQDGAAQVQAAAASAQAAQGAANAATTQAGNAAAVSPPTQVNPAEAQALGMQPNSGGGQ